MYLGPEGNRSHWYTVCTVAYHDLVVHIHLGYLMFCWLLTSSSVQCKIKSKTHIRCLANKFTSQHLLFISVLVTESGVVYDYLIVVPDAPTVKIYIYTPLNFRRYLLYYGPRINQKCDILPATCRVISGKTSDPLVFCHVKHFFLMFVRVCGVGVHSPESGVSSASAASHASSSVQSLG